MRKLMRRARAVSDKKVRDRVEQEESKRRQDLQQEEATATATATAVAAAAAAAAAIDNGVWDPYMPFSEAAATAAAMAGSVNEMRGVLDDVLVVERPPIAVNHAMADAPTSYQIPTTTYHAQPPQPTLQQQQQQQQPPALAPQESTADFHPVSAPVQPQQQQQPTVASFFPNHPPLPPQSHHPSAHPHLHPLLHQPQYLPPQQPPLNPHPSSIGPVAISPSLADINAYAAAQQQYNQHAAQQQQQQQHQHVNHGKGIPSPLDNGVQNEDGAPENWPFWEQMVQDQGDVGWG
jgi:hypothetical protein